MLATRKFRSPKARRRQRTRRALVTGAGVLAVACLFGALVYAVHMPALRVGTIELAGVDEEQEVLLRGALEQLFSGTFFGVLPRDSLALARSTQIVASVLEADPRLKAAEVKRTSLHTFHVSVENREAAALWCGEVVPPTEYGDDTASGTPSVGKLWGSCYVMDDTSFIFAPALGGTDRLPRYYGPLVRARPVGQLFIESAEFTSFVQLRTRLSELGYPTSAMLIVDEAQLELYLEDGMRLLVSRNADVETLVRELAALTEAGSWSRDKPIEYLDLRWEGKAYFKYRDAGGEGE